MFIQQSLNKRIAVTDTVVLDLLYNNQFGFGIFIENQDAANTMVYRFEQSVDGGTTWVVVPFAVEGSDVPATIFAITARDTHHIKVSAAGRVRMVARGDLNAACHLSIFRPSLTDTTPVTIVNQ